MTGEVVMKEHVIFRTTGEQGANMELMVTSEGRVVLEQLEQLGLLVLGRDLTDDDPGTIELSAYLGGR